MGTRDPGFNRALEQAGQSILEAAIQSARLAEQRREFDETQTLEYQKFAEYKKVDALDRLLKMGALTKPGSTLAQNPALHRDIEEIWPGANPKDEGETGMGRLVLNPETWNNVIIPQILDQVSLLSPEAKKEFLQRSGAKLGIGEGLSPKEMELRSGIVDYQLQAFKSVTKDPVVLEDAGRALLGQGPIVRIPLAGGKFKEFTTTDAAHIWAQFLMHDEDIGLGWAQLTESAKGRQADISNEFMKQMETLGVILPRSASNAIMHAYGLTLSEKPEDQAKGVTEFNRLLMDKNPQISGSTRVFLTGAKISEYTKSQWRKDAPAVDLAETIREDLSRTREKAEIDQVMPGVTRAINRAYGYDRVPRFDRFQWFNPADYFHNWGYQGAGTDATAIEQNANVAAEEFAAGRLTLKEIQDNWDPGWVTAIMQKAQDIKKKGKR